MLRFKKQRFLPEKNHEKSIKVDGFKARIGRIGKFDAA
jgi:hypothetical protein